MAADSLDAELGGLLFKLKKIENAAGKKEDGPQSVIGEDGKEDKFLTLKEKILSHVEIAKTVLFLPSQRFVDLNLIFYGVYDCSCWKLSRVLRRRQAQTQKI